MTRTPLTQDQLDQFRQDLLRARREIAGDLEGVQEDIDDEVRPQGAPAGDAPTHPAEAAPGLYERELNRELEQTERDLVVEIDEALRRIEDGAYGLCQEGGEPIEIKRLRARPWARLCLHHARQAQQDQSGATAP